VHYQRHDQRLEHRIGKVVVSIRSRLRQSKSAPLPFCRFLLSGILSWRLHRPDATMTTHVKATVRSCFAALRQIHSVRRSLSQHALLTLIRALVVSKVDYCCSVLTGVSGHLRSRLYSLSFYHERCRSSNLRSEHVTPLLHDLHWLRVPERIQFRLCVLAFRCLRGSAPSYLANQSSSRRRCRWSSASAFIRRDHASRPVDGDRAFPVAAPRTWNLEPSVCISPDRDVLIDVSSRTEDIPFRSSYQGHYH